ncbi:hypothetical protein Q7A53_05730 [Halobacillus rhizosphaerae]|uniref:hypothetical protein n=1 Tax=Halobacillus rhizosphaerae TaxID=3064889 RepID=UPI00398AED1F
MKKEQMDRYIDKFLRDGDVECINLTTLKDTFDDGELPIPNEIDCMKIKKELESISKEMEEIDDLIEIEGESIVFEVPDINDFLNELMMSGIKKSIDKRNK